MKIDKNIKLHIIATLLLATLVTPSWIQFSHQLDEMYDTTICHEEDDHLHGDEVLHPDLCIYQLTNFYFEFPSHPELQVSPIISNIAIGTTNPSCYSLSITNTQLRAPPVFS
jgi:hypothetical protein